MFQACQVAGLVGVEHADKGGLWLRYCHADTQFLDPSLNPNGNLIP